MPEINMTEAKKKLLNIVNFSLNSQWICHIISQSIQTANYVYVTPKWQFSYDFADCNLLSAKAAKYACHSPTNTQLLTLSFHLRYEIFCKKNRTNFGSHKKPIHIVSRTMEICRSCWQFYQKLINAMNLVSFFSLLFAGKLLGKPTIWPTYMENNVNEVTLP